jgi:trimeric autotransporter adhesin
VDACNLVTGWRGTSATITSLSPAIIAAGNAAFTLTVNGSGFTGYAIVQWNGTPLPTTFVSATQLTATVSATLIVSPETVAVTVASGGKISGSISFTVKAPAISVNDQRVTTQAPPASGCVVPSSVTTFQTTNNFIYLYFNAVVSSSDELMNNWLAPDGTVIPGTQWSQATGNLCFDNAPALAISNLPAARLGTWVARVYDNGTLLFSIAFSVTAPAPSVVVTSVANAASGASRAIAPGEMVAIKGSGLGPAAGLSFSLDPVTGMVDTTLAGTQVFFGSYAAAITYTSAGQINTIVPYEIAGQSQITMQVQYQGASSAGIVLQVAIAAPGAFTFNGTGTGQAIAANQDGTFNGASNPAAPGSYVTVYFTGGGETNPPGVDGSVTGLVLKWLTQPVTVTVGGVAATVAFDGAAPTFVDGVGQLNIQLANNTPSGTALPLVITVGGINSAATATLSVQ